LKVKKLGILYQNDEYGRSVFELLKEDFEKTGRTVKSEAFEPKEVDYKKQIANLKDMEAIYTVGFESRLKNVFRQLREENFRGFIIGASGASGPNITSMPEANGAYVAAPIVYNPNFLFAKELKEKYEAKYNKPFTQFAANGYDFVKLLAGLLGGKEISRENIKSLLEEGFIYSGVFGSLNVKPGEHDIVYPLHPAQIVDGEVKYLR
jgi:branched-chain amino acid transport system substrate-binding protein